MNVMPQHETELPVGARKSPKNGGLRRGPKFRSDETLEEFRAREAADLYRKAAGAASAAYTKAEADVAKADEHATKTAEALAAAIEAEASIVVKDERVENAKKAREDATKAAEEAGEKLRGAILELEAARDHLYKTVVARGRAELEAAAAEDAFRRRNHLRRGIGWRRTYVK